MSLCQDAANNGRAEPRDAETETQPAQLIESLGSASFAERTAASRKLRDMGFSAVPALRQARRHPDAEVRYRAKQLLAVIERMDLRQQLDRFLKTPSEQTASRLPGWREFTKIAGRSSAAFTLFGLMQSAEPELFRNFGTEPLKLQKLVEQRTMEIHGVNLPSAPPSQPRTDEALQAERSRRQRLLGGICAAMLVQSSRGLEISSNTSSFMYGLVNFDVFQQALADEHTGEIVHRLFGHWFARAEDVRSHQRLMLAMRFGLKEGLQVAEDQIVKSPRDYPTQYALLTIGKLNDVDRIELVKSQLSNTFSLLRRVRVAPAAAAQQRDCRLCDVALAVLWHLHGEDPRKHGFVELRRDPQFLFQPNSMVFKDDAAREAAFQEWSVWISKRDGRPAAGRDD